MASFLSSIWKTRYLRWGVVFLALIVFAVLVKTPSMFQQLTSVTDQEIINYFDKFVFTNQTKKITKWKKPINYAIIYQKNTKVPDVTFFQNTIKQISSISNHKFVRVRPRSLGVQT
ncbi:MAG: hypothetical protein O2912_02075, partial [Proteobacteria bacterium]|nr:hypothetical protein [Pseudomonadota bacterium]